MKTLNISKICSGLSFAITSVLLTTAQVTTAQTNPDTTIPEDFGRVYTLKRYAPQTNPVTFNALVALSGLPVPPGTNPNVAAKSTTFSGTRFVTSGNQKDPTAFFSLDISNGAISFSKSLKRYEGDFLPSLPQTPEEAERIARNYLNDNKLLPVLAANEKQSLASVQTVTAARPELPPPGRPLRSGAQVAVTNLEFPQYPGGAKEFDKLKIATFQREINLLPVVGPGSKAVVTIGHTNEVEGAIVRWREFVTPSIPTNKPPVVSPTEARNSIIATLKRQNPDLDEEAVQKLILEQGIALYDSNQNAIQPVHVFVVQMGTEPDASNPYDFVPGSETEGKMLTFVPYLKTPPEPVPQLGDVSTGVTAPKQAPTPADE
ncbi:MAG: hypothetical protein JHC85_09450 [Chthoniobacterales bacterium]|nr:hypothetical protein [Chthoniobacterales bacterium]